MKFLRLARSFALLPIALALTLGGCETPEATNAPSAKYSSKRYSVNFRDSLALRQMPPLHERGIKSLALLYRPYDKVALMRGSNVGLATAGLGVLGAAIGTAIDAARSGYFEADAEAVLLSDLVSNQFVAESENAPFVRLIRLTEEEEARLAGHVIDKGFYNKRSFDEAGKKMLSDLADREIDAVVLVDEQRILNYREIANHALPSKGIFWSPANTTWVVAGFRFALIDTASGKEMDKTAFVQASAAATSLPWWGPLEQYSPAEQVQIRAVLEARVANNVRVMLELLKAIPAEDGEFLGYDPKELRRAPDYPE